ncbi:hypothetical protein NHX12_007828 [Muraenolepis orangiensis]|uniref:Uncharacterized protein n=1 Tax=Muraenolepis orangiensis TaxID=630683 RepID=A0A9Q0DQP0_9TELE|nr:hypothetical protein NHX12_007828 [Muraenolepis orangiensis]
MKILAVMKLTAASSALNEKGRIRVGDGVTQGSATEPHKQASSCAPSPSAPSETLFIQEPEDGAHILFTGRREAVSGGVDSGGVDSVLGGPTDRVLRVHTLNK